MYSKLLASAQNVAFCPEIDGFSPARNLAFRKYFRDPPDYVAISFQLLVR